MIRSMTAFARCHSENPFGGILIWEIYSVNHRYLEATFRLPEALRILEPQLRARLSPHIRRGKIECQLKLKLLETQNPTLHFNQKLAEALAQVNGELQAVFKQQLSLPLTDILAWPGMLQNTMENSSLLHVDVLSLFDQTLQELTTMRHREGQATKLALESHLQQLSQEIENIKILLPNFLKQQREKILARIDELKINVDSARLEQELLFIAQKADIREEIERLHIHLVEVQKILEMPDAVGRRLDFLMQELHREANTLGSKSSDSTIMHAVINLKVWIEQMREQVQNIE